MEESIKDIKRNIAQNMQFLRNESGLKQQKLGEYLGITKEQVSYIECMKRPIDVIKLKKIADLFNIPMDELLSKKILEYKANVFAFRSDDIDSKTLEAIAFINEFANDLIKLKKL